MSPDVLDELNAKIEDLVIVAERERERILTDLMNPFSREDSAQWALDYAMWTALAREYRRLVRPQAAIARVK